MAVAPPRKVKPATPILSDGFPVAFQEGLAREAFAAICVFCMGDLAKVRLIEKGQGRGGYAVMCAACSSTMFLCSPQAVKQWRALQALLRMDEPRNALNATLATLRPPD